MPKPRDIDVRMVKDKQDFFVVVDGVRIARRGYPNTPQVGTWVSLEPGWEVTDGEGLKTIAVKYKVASIH
jgi:hypothetical protein